MSNRIRSIYFSILIGLIFLGCSTINPVDIVEIQKICKLVISQPDTLIPIRRDSLVSFNAWNYSKSIDNRIADSNQIIYLKKWFSSDYIIDTSYVYSHKLPFYNGKKIEMVNRTIYRIEFKSKLTAIEFSEIEEKYFCFEFYNINNKWLLVEHDTLNISQRRNKFNRLNRHPDID